MAEGVQPFDEELIALEKEEDQVLRSLKVTSSSDERLYRLQLERTRLFERSTSGKFEKIFKWQEENRVEIARISTEIKLHRETENGHGSRGLPSIPMPSISKNQIKWISIALFAKAAVGVNLAQAMGWIELNGG